jgi:hypothetical protein
VIDHEWFDDISFKEISKQIAEAPYIPDIEVLDEGRLDGVAERIDNLLNNPEEYRNFRMSESIIDQDQLAQINKFGSLFTKF